MTFSLPARFLLLLASASNVLLAQAPCPQCDSSKAPMSGHGQANQDSELVNGTFTGQASSNDARYVVTVKIDPSWNVTDAYGTHTDNRIWNATVCGLYQGTSSTGTGGMHGWNTATDSGGNTTHYFFKLSAGTQNSQSNDLTIVKSAVPSDSAAFEGIDPYGPPYKIYLPSKNDDGSYPAITDADLCGRIAHAVGHSLNLVNSDAQGNVNCDTTIMSGRRSDGTRTDNQISSGDVASANNNYANYTSCTYNPTPNPPPDTTDEQACDTTGNACGLCNSEYNNQVSACNQSGSFWDDDQCSCQPLYECGLDEFQFDELLDECDNAGGYWSYDRCQCDWESPIILDVDGNGFRLTSAADGVLFKMNPAGDAIQIAWTAAGSTTAFLVLDRNGNGAIDNGSELFGNYTPQHESARPNGFIALAEYDKVENGGNGDGVIDARDAVFSRLRLWIDANHDGISQANEFFPLATFGIETIALDFRLEQRRDRYGNVFRFRSRFTGHDPSNGAPFVRNTYDVLFRTVNTKPSTARTQHLALLRDPAMTLGEFSRPPKRRRQKGQGPSCMPALSGAGSLQ